MIESANKVEISKKALKHNFAICQKKAGNAKILAMIKADAYGHGMIQCAQVFAKCGAYAFGVAEVIEGVSLRQNGINHPILVMAGTTPQNIKTILNYKLTPVIADKDIIKSIEQTRTPSQDPVGVHIKLDVGMGRQGASSKELASILNAIQATKDVVLDGIMAHFPMADDQASDHSDKMVALFSKVLIEAGLNPASTPCIHIANSGGLFYITNAINDMVRPGIALYGYYPDGKAGRTQIPKEKQLQPVMHFSSHVIQTRTVEAGVGLGYGHSFITQRQTKLAIIPVGYEDGYLRNLSNKAFVLIKGQKAPVIGRISMNLTIIDVTDLPPISIGDHVVLLGKQEDNEITADDIAEWMDTISYEVLCLFGKMNARSFVEY